MQYIKYHWNETTGDPITNDWGTSIFYVEIRNDAYPIKQLQLFENKKFLKYDLQHFDDKYGGLGDQPVDKELIEKHKITEEEFYKNWNNHL